jgi:hypothetical protein
MASTTASSAVADVLRQPDDLLKLAAYRKKLLKEKSTLDAKLASGVKAQLEATRDALLKLQASRAAVGIIREEMMAVEKLKGGEDGGEAFDKITRVSRTFPLTSPGSTWMLSTGYIHPGILSIAEPLVGLHCSSKPHTDHENGEQPPINVRKSRPHFQPPRSR